MATEHQGSEIAFFVRDYGTTGVWRRLTCEETLTFDLTNEVTSTKTKCGTFKGVDVAEFKVSGSGVCNFTPAATEYSHDALTTDQVAVQKKEFRIQDVATSGSLILLAGAGYFTQSQISAPANDVVKFTYTFDGTGTLEQHES